MNIPPPFPRSITSLGSRHGLTLLGCACAFALFSSAKADVIYRETFGVQPGATADVVTTAFDWQRFTATGIANAAVGVNYNNPGRLTDVANVEAGPNADGTSGAYTNGILYMSGSQNLALTTEYSFDLAGYENVSFSWYEGNAHASESMRMVIRIDGLWYASTDTFTTAAMGIAGFGAQAELKTLAFDPDPAKWSLLNFNGNYTVGVTPGTGTPTNSSLGTVTLGAAPAAPLSGVITGFGVYTEFNGGTGNMRLDTFQIDATAVPEPSGAHLLLVAGASFLLFRYHRRRRVS